jgi:hypothetical protein
VEIVKIQTFEQKLMHEGGGLEVWLPALELKNAQIQSFDNDVNEPALSALAQRYRTFY